MGESYRFNFPRPLFLRGRGLYEGRAEIARIRYHNGMSAEDAIRLVGLTKRFPQQERLMGLLPEVHLQVKTRPLAARGQT